MSNAPPDVDISRAFPNSPDGVFEAWVTPALMRRWLFASDTNEIREVSVVLRRGGPFSIVEFNKGTRIDHFGEYERIDRPTHLAFTLEVPKHFTGVTRVQIDLSPEASGCLMRFRQSGVKREVVESSWRSMFERLGAILSGPT
jgi:uncharacterized protein YndB with AHSA1/START domain